MKSRQMKKKRLRLFNKKHRYILNSKQQNL